MVKSKLKKNDNVMVTSGADRGKRGKILYVDRKLGRIVIEGINKKKKFVRPSQEN
ncbi:MAG TPA: KOW motif domain-containing protein, partial [Spirochaetota bacterium]|nr:KOW motif domain-containing protein [Spirochaetota bacterium]